MTPTVLELVVWRSADVEADGDVDAAAAAGATFEGEGDVDADADADGDGTGGGAGGFKDTISLVTVMGFPPSWRSRTIVEPKTSPEEETAAAATYRRVVFVFVLVLVLGRVMIVSKPWRGDWMRRLVWLLMVLWSLEANF
jgi:hypothetical protein